ncbi:Zonadhesin [Wickerhamomyces ciferrii]|uniref:Zonadhesin n=1 Tax=Wickerhamomyces ciferrii (strain ATCC 14091 / BCRC 22168 / CBS 111 / JCM 3599 / NBRC 0793 / NRRL Y-1031 F-60-10) TaxID=1206466 RepID=K0KJ27_WICCF|nr:Zonadhesin [Wickerhamomyces ciferrii]CCH41474.1 Zonadhesin [Wickerhamomyces ciferrii]
MSIKFNWILMILIFINSSQAQIAATGPYTYRTNPNFPTTGRITTAESLQGTRVTATRSTVPVTRITPTTQTTRTTQQQQTTQTTTQQTSQPQPTQQTSQPATSEPAPEPSTQPTTEAPSTQPTTQTPSAEPTENPQPQPGVYYSTTTVFTTEQIQNTIYSTIYSTVTFNKDQTSTITNDEVRTEVDNTETIYSQSLSKSTRLTTIPGQQVTSNWVETVTGWSESFTTSTLTIPYPSLSIDVSTITHSNLQTYYQPVETVITNFENSLVVLPNTTYTSQATNILTSTRFEQFITTNFNYEYQTSTHTGTQFATLTYTNGLWYGVTDLLNHATTIQSPDSVETQVADYEFIYGISTITNFKTITEQIAQTTIYQTISSTITSTITEYIQNGETIYPLATITYTFTSTTTEQAQPTQTQAQPQPTQTQAQPTQTEPQPQPTQSQPPQTTPTQTVTVSVSPSSIHTVTSTTSILPTECIPAYNVQTISNSDEETTEGIFEIQTQTNAGNKLNIGGLSILVLIISSFMF